MTRRMLLAGVGLWLICGALSVRAAEFHVATDGTPQGDGSPEKPWDLATAITPGKAVKPGDTIWLHGGTYRGGFKSELVGSPDAPIVVRGKPGARVKIDLLARDERDQGALYLMGADVVYRDFEVTCTHPARETKIAGSWPEDIRRGSVDIRGSRISAVNLVVHNLASGFGYWAEGEGGEISGCVIYNNGWRGPDRGHGHAIYAQNVKGTKRIYDNILFHQFGYGIHVYGSEKSFLKGFEIEGNFAFNNGCLAKSEEHAPGVMVGGASPAERIVVRDNVVVGGGIRLGYPWGVASDDVLCTGNYADEGLVVRDFRRATVMQNTVVAHSNVVQMQGAGKLLLKGQRWNENEYFLTDGRWGECAVVEDNKSRGVTFEEWRKITGFDAKSTFKKGAPDAQRIVLRPNAYERGRANLGILNPALLPEVEVDLSEVLQQGQAFRIVSAKDFYGTPVVSGVYSGGAVRVPMKPIPAPATVGLPNVKPPQTEPGFAVFVVLPDA